MQMCSFLDLIHECQLFAFILVSTLPVGSLAVYTAVEPRLALGAHLVLYGSALGRLAVGAELADLGSLSFL
jgi:hypothetical protein